MIPPHGGETGATCCAPTAYPVPIPVRPFLRGDGGRSPQWLIFLFRLRGRGQGVHKGRPYGIGSRWARLLTEQPGDGAGELLGAIQVCIEGVG